MHAEAEAASEQMKISETLCGAIADRADMFDELLSKLNRLFSDLKMYGIDISNKTVGEHDA